MQNRNKIDFTFGWLAMKLLGKSLYSNSWSALSELVANGFDAGAQNVYIYINMSNKKESTIEIFDDGKGMSEKEINTYIKVGYNKRENLEVQKTKPMGRKGIGKLAALYLSQDYYIITKTKDGLSNRWQMTYRENHEDEHEKPFLQRIENDKVINIEAHEQWSKCSTGTLVKLTNVNLAGKGDIALNSLEHKLSNYFSLNSSKRKIWIYTYVNGKNDITFEEIKKNIAFKNMAFISHAPILMSLLGEYNEISNHYIKLPFSKTSKKNEEYYTQKIQLSRIDKNIYKNNLDIEGEREFTTIDHKEEKFKYTLKGWIGIHSSIDKNTAGNNDARFEKSTDYNPNQLRLYVRDKLAIENFLNVINNTQAFVNYIEGEISFDLLDEDTLPDIATSNRQNMDEHDERIQLLKDLVEPIITDLISKRNDLAKIIKQKQEEKQEARETSAKKVFSKEITEELNSLGDKIPEDVKNDLAMSITNKVKGDIAIKDERLIFLSHASANAEITNFIYHLLIYKGIKENEFFYTSKDGKKEDTENRKTLGEIIKKSITNTSNFLFYLTSQDYKDSEFCMFEGGAGWATRSILDYELWSLAYKDIPVFLTNGKIETTLGDRKLTRSNYNRIVATLNKMIAHINNSRQVRGEAKIDLFKENVVFPDKVQLATNGETEEDYMDEKIKQYWSKYIT
jgi:hypothetical protein